MKLEVEVSQTAVPELSALRERYFDSLPGSQEAFLEVQVPSSTGYLLQSRGETVGYALAADDSLLEVYLHEPYAVFGQTVCDQLIAHAGLKRALVKSFDALMLSSLIDRHQGLRSIGLLVRDYVKRPLPERPDLRYSARLASVADMPLIQRVDQQVFTRPERLQLLCERGLLVLFERDALLGFGIMRPVVPGRPGVDIGIALDKPYREHGYAAYFLQYMADTCVARGLTPICSCAVDNHVVRAAGERIGMYAKHRLLELLL